ncbi:TetR/AcrR family transcriptional regulator [Nonomuraea longicatena]|uniref:TetR/AcrR family transcriptional regulator n=1 Tax=Nonomuraea longicatena TaxID=83682 RepID=A0ABN1QKV2_9ACTN
MTVADTGLRARTRRAILDAAFATLIKNPSASLSDVAASAGVGRTTIHRYFPERSALLTAMGQDVLDKIGAATLKARPEEGPALAALDRLCQEYFELGDYLMLAFMEPTLTSPEWEEESESDRMVAKLISRAHREGSIDPAMPASWVHQVLWTLMYAGWQHVREDEAPKHDALTLCLRSLRKILAP